MSEQFSEPAVGSPESVAKASTNQSYQAHIYADTDNGPLAVHHTLGRNSDQAAPGNHKHKLADVTDYVAPTIPPVELSYKVGVLTTNNVNSSGTNFTDIMSTDTLDVGTWLVNFTVTYQTNSSTTASIFKLVANTVTATFNGPNEVETVAGTANQQRSVNFSCVVVVTAAGTLKLQARASTGIITVRYQANSLSSELAVTGYTAIKIV